MKPIKPKFKQGDIICSDYGNTWIVAQVSNRTDSYYGFNAKETYALPYERQDNFKKIGEFPINTVQRAIDDAKNKFIDLETQISIAVRIMGEILTADGKDNLLIGTDLRVSKVSNIVWIECSVNGGIPNKWETIIDICEEYGINKHGI